MQIGHKIAQLRNRKKISQKQLALDLHVSVGLIGLWETNKRLPSLESFLLLIDYFEVSADVLLEEDRKLTSEQYAGAAVGLSAEARKLLNAFSRLDEDNRDILIGEAKRLLKEQSHGEKKDYLPPAKAN